MSEKKSESTLTAPSARTNAGKHSVERRTSKRFTLVATADVLDTGTGTRLAGRISDLSISGCYMDVMSPFAENTNVHIRIKFNGQSVDLKGSVRFSHGGLGMGIAFTSLTPSQLETIGAWIGVLTGERKELHDPQFDEVEQTVVTQKPAGDRQALDELLMLLVRKGILKHSEISHLLAR